ncbi:MAG: VCBS repeat-containing protein, partial [Candidatus Dadabacteria bacterium]|nr:VCBS repeat-containing protein [Candidatus Dadabacteria bacterium]
MKPGQRSGIHELKQNPAEYLIEPSNYYEHMGSNMLKLDINGDGNMDLAVAGGYYSYYAPAVRIYDGSSQVKYPNLRETTASSKWKIDWGNDYNNYYMGQDIAVGDVNGDGYDDILVGSSYYYSGHAYLYYGGPQWDSRSKVYPYNADVTFESAYYDQSFGKGIGIGDVNGDGYGDVIITSAYNSYAYIWFGSSSMSGWKYTSSSSVRISGSYIGYSGVATGDFTGDGRDEVVFCSPMASSSAYVMSPTSSITSGISISASSGTYALWMSLRVTGSYAGCYPALIEDYNNDGYADIFVGAPTYSTGYVFVMNGRSTFPEGTKNIYSSGVYDLAFY